jgi:F0F1-type ATP synthase assembly protein I
MILCVSVLVFVPGFGFGIWVVFRKATVVVKMVERRRTASRSIQSQQTSPDELLDSPKSMSEKKLATEMTNELSPRASSSASSAASTSIHPPSTSSTTVNLTSGLPLIAMVSIDSSSMKSDVELAPISIRNSNPATTSTS